ncbi:hypothetical protein Tco_0889047 [Tanacetum coccineum]
MAMRTQPTMSPGLSARVTEAMTLSPLSFRKRYRSFYETPSPSSSPYLLIRKRYPGTLKLVEDTEDESSNSDTKGEGSEDEGPGSEDEGPGSEEEKEKAAPEGQQQAVPVVDTAADEPLGLGYRVLRCRELALGEGSMPSKFEIGQSSRSVLEKQRVEETPAPRPPVRATWRLNALPPALFEGYDRDLRELYTRSRAVRDEIFSQCYRLRSLEQEQERATMTFDAIWRPVLALESWA